MSIKLSQNPNNIHELVDDLQSVFWVLLYAAVKFVTPAGAKAPLLKVFDDPDDRLDEKGKRVRGHLKRASLGHAEPWDLRYGSDILKNLLKDFRGSWADYLEAEQKNSAPGPDQLPDETRRTLQVASEPSFWREKLAAALRRYDVEEKLLETSSKEHLHVPAVRKPAHSYPAVLAGTKRKVDDEEDLAGSPAGPMQPRRSKRLKEQHL